MEWFKRLFVDEKKFWILATALLTPVALRRGFNKPIRWAATQAQVDYSHGFVKRGLFGELVSRPLHLERYLRFTIVSTLLLVALLVLLVLFAKTTGMLKRCGSAMPLALFGASYTVTYLGNLNGYLDIPLGILTVSLLMVKEAQRRAWLAVPVVIAAILIHELFLVVFFPVLLLSFFLQGLFAEKDQKTIFAFGIGVTLLAVGVTVGTALKASSTPQAASRMRAEIARRVDFKIDPLFFEVMERSAMDNAKVMDMYYRMPAWRRAHFSAICVWGPMDLIFLTMGSRLLALSGKRVWKIALTGCIAAALSPIAMNVLGWDLGRWYALAGLTAFITLGTICLYVPGPGLDGRAGFGRAAVIAIALGMATSGFLIEGTIRPYPFF